MSSRVAALVTPQDQEILEKLLTSADDIVYMSGSRVEGLGNPRSDIDYFVVTVEEIDRAQQPVLRPRYYIDCEYHSKSALGQLANTIRSAAEDPKEIDRVPLNEIDLYYRTAIGVPVINSSSFKSLQADFDKQTGGMVYRATAARRAGVHLIAARVDVILGDDLVALFEARMAAIWATNSFLAGHGESYPGHKWRFEKAARCFGRLSPEYARIWDIQNIGSRDVTEYVEAVTDYVHWCRLDESLLAPNNVPALDTLVARALDVKESYTDSNILVSNSEGKLFSLLGPVADLWNFIAAPQEVGAIVQKIGNQLEVGMEVGRMVVQKLIERLESRSLILIGATPEKLFRGP